MPFDREGNWKPNKKQAIFLSVPTSVKEAAYLGGAGSGKSEVLLAYPIIYKWHENPRFKQVFMRRTYPELRLEIVPRSRELYRPFGAKFNKSTMTWTFPRPDQYGSGMNPDGANIILGHCEDEDDVHNYDSMEINLFTPDEITTFTEFIYLYIGFTRTRTSDPNLPAIIRTAGMPGGIGHTWVKKRFVDPAKHGGKIIVGKGGNKRIFIHATQADNPHVDQNYKQSLEGLSEAEKQAKLYGSFDAYLGQVFDEFRTRRVPDEPENALHVVEPFDIPAWWPRIFVIDWGYAALTYVGYGAISPSGKLYIYRERAWQKTKIEEWAPFVKEDIEREHPRLVKICKSAGQDRGQEHTILQQVTEALGTTIHLTTNSPGSRVSGKTLLHEYLRWKPKYQPDHEIPVYNEEYAMWLLRNRGEKEYKSYLHSLNPQEPETNIPKLQIFNTCTLLINAIQSCIYDKIRVEDVAEFDGDDPYDVIRYMCDAADAYFDEAKREFAEIQRREVITRHFETTRDWNYLYRNARLLEQQNEIKAIRRYHK